MEGKDKIPTRGVAINQPNIDSQGNLQSYMPATPIGMLCERNGCGKSEGADYRREPQDKDGTEWDTEPIYLCEKHSKGHTPFPNSKAQQ